jgi:uncharacterized protein
MTKKTLIIGASTKPERYAYKAAKMLLDHGHKIVLLGNKPGVLFGLKIGIAKRKLTDIHTVTLYLNQQNQQEYLNYIIKLKPKRVVFNPGTENPEFYTLLKANNIEFLEACTLVLLSTNQY